MTLGEDLDQIGFEADDWSFEGCRRRMRKATAVVLAAETAYQEAAGFAADAEAVYRRELARKFKGHRADGLAVEAATTMARSDVAPLSRERDYRKDMLRLALERLEDARDSRRSVWRLIEWSRDREVALIARNGQGDEREPREQWP